MYSWKSSLQFQIPHYNVERKPQIVYLIPNVITDKARMQRALYYTHSIVVSEDRPLCLNSVANTGLDRTPEGHRRCNGVSKKKGSFERMLIGQVQAEKKEEGGDLPCAGRFCFSAYPSTPRARLSSATPAVSAAAGRGPLPPTDRNCCHFIAMGIPKQGVHALRTVPRPGEREKKKEKRS